MEIFIAVISDGFQVCSTRVNQSYTAAMIGSGSTYLSRSFFEGTEECFGEAISLAEEKYESQFRNFSKKLNYLASEVHWLHKSLSKTDEPSALAEGSSDNNQRFAKIEQLKNQLTDELSELRNSVDDKIQSTSQRSSP